MRPTSIASINRLPPDEKRSIYCRFIPPELLERFSIPADIEGENHQGLLTLRAAEGTTDVTFELRHAPQAEDPILFAHLTDTINGQIHVLLYVLNDPESPRFNVDRLPDGTPTRFGIVARNLEAEQAALEAGLAPGQIRRGLRMLGESIRAFEMFVESLTHEVYFIEPLYYHNAVIFERYGFSYQKGMRRMQAYHQGFSPGGDLRSKLDGRSAFRQPWMADSIRGRSWALHDGIAGTPYSDVTMYKRIGVQASISTFPGGAW